MEKTQKQREAEAAAHRVIAAYRAVFGIEGQRSSAQDIVWKDMAARSRVDSPVFITDPEGKLCPIRAGIAEGMRLNFIQLKAIVELSPESEKPETEVKR